MTTTDRVSSSGGLRDERTSVPRLSGDELFVPASHVLVIDRQVSHPAFRLWCVLHRLWFLREPPTMEVLQDLMGAVSHPTAVASDGRLPAVVWLPATRRSIERWLKELEAAGWLVWSRHEESSRRYHLRTSARSAGDRAVLHELRSLLNSGKATLADVQVLLGAIPGTTIALPRSDDATLPSHDPNSGSHQDAEAAPAPLADATPESHSAMCSDLHATHESHDATGGSHHTTPESHDATAESQLPAGQTAHTTPESHDATGGSHHTTPESHDATGGSHHATPESHDATGGSYGGPADGVLMRQNQPPYREIREKEISEDQIPPPPPAASAAGGDRGGPTATERYLIRQGFSVKAAHEFRALDCATVQAELERRRELGQGIGAIVTSWRVDPPQAVPPEAEAFHAQAAADAKAQALTLAPPDASALEIQYLALDLEDGLPPAAALAHLQARRAGAGGAS